MLFQVRFDFCWKSPMFPFLAYSQQMKSQQTQRQKLWSSIDGKKKKKKVLEQFIDYNVVIQNSFLGGLVVMVMHLVIGELLLFFKKRRI